MHFASTHTIIIL